jgi:hypothetical protein
MEVSHKYLLERSKKYESVNRIGLCEFYGVGASGQIILKLRNPNLVFSTPFSTISKIWPILSPGFHVKKQFFWIEIIHSSENTSQLEIDIYGYPETIKSRYREKTEFEFISALDTTLDYYLDLLINHIFSIKISTSGEYGWSPYKNGDIDIVSNLVNLIKSQFIRGISGEDISEKLSDEIYWVREILVNVKNSKNHIPEDLIKRAKEKYIELEFITSIM